ADGLGGSGQSILGRFRRLARLLAGRAGGTRHATAGAVSGSHHPVTKAAEPLAEWCPATFHYATRAHTVADGPEIPAGGTALALQVGLQLISPRAHCTSSLTLSAVLPGTGRTRLSLSFPLGSRTAAA